MITSYEIKELALVGLQAQLQRVNEKIAGVQAKLRGKAVSIDAWGGTHVIPALLDAEARARRTHYISAAGRKRISDAQKRRWARAKGAK